MIMRPERLPGRIQVDTVVGLPAPGIRILHIERDRCHPGRIGQFDHVAMPMHLVPYRLLEQGATKIRQA